MINRFENEYFFLSNFYPYPIVFNMEEYDTTEHAFQAAKSLNKDERLWVAMASSPGIAKRRGRKITLRADWDNVKLRIMSDIIYTKFFKSKMTNLLLATRNSELIEGNYWHDNFWGDCLCSRCSNIQGLNHLGLILMDIRDEYADITR